MIRFFTSTNEGILNGILREFYEVGADIMAFDIQSNSIIATTEDGEVCPLRTCIELSVPKPPRGQADTMPSVEWECIAAILAHETRMLFNNGVPVDISEQMTRRNADWDPLRRLGYLGWPGLVLAAFGMPMVHTFRRAATDRKSVV